MGGGRSHFLLTFKIWRASDEKAEANKKFENPRFLAASFDITWAAPPCSERWKLQNDSHINSKSKQYLGQQKIKTSCKKIQGCWTCCPPCAPENRFGSIKVFPSEITVILGWAGMIGFSGAFDLESEELDLSPWRAARRKERVSYKKSSLSAILAPPARSLSTESGSTTLTPLLRSAQAALAAFVFACFFVSAFPM